MEVWLKSKCQGQQKLKRRGVKSREEVSRKWSEEIVEGDLGRRARVNISRMHNEL